MKDKYLILKVKQEKNIVIINIVNIPECANVDKTLISMPLDDRDDCFFITTSSAYHCPEIINGGVCHGLVLPIPKDYVYINEIKYDIIINFTSYQFDSEEEANTYLTNLSKAVALYNEHIRYKEADNNYIATNEWTVMQ